MSKPPVDERIADASTVIVLRELGGGIETFMLCRHHQSGFMGGAHVFPGGKVDPSDCDAAWRDRVNRSPVLLAEGLGENDAELSLGLLVAAIRETLEEAGVLLARIRSRVDVSTMRDALHGGASFLDLARSSEMQIDAGLLTPYARWVTPKMESRRFDTRFYVAALPEGQVASHDGGELTSAAWLRPAQAIDDMLAGRMKLAPPTVRTLRWLAEFDDIESIVADALSRKPPLVRPRIVTGKEGWFLALPGDAEHPERKRALPGATRMLFDNGAWCDAPEPVR